MSYCDVDDIRNYAANLSITMGADPTQANVDEIITSVSADMDQRFKVIGVDTPVTDSDVLEMLKPICANGVIEHL